MDSPGHHMTSVGGETRSEIVSLRPESQRSSASPAVAGSDRGHGLRILMLSPQPFFRARGTPFSVLHRIRGIVAAGHHVDLLAYPFGSDVPLPELSIVRCARPPFVNDVGIGPSLAKVGLDISMFMSARQMLANGDYDLVHSHEEAAFFGVALARRHGLRHIYDMHSSLPQQLANFRAYNWGPFRSLFSRLERYALQNSAGIITVCPDLEEIVRGTCPDTPHAMIENTADDTNIFGFDEKDVRKEWGLSGKKVIVYTGTLEAYQGIDMLISGMAGVRAKIPDAHLLIVGGQPRQIEQYRKLVSDVGVEKAVTFTGTRPPSDMPSFTRAADVIVSPRSRGTNTPAKVYGYLRTGRPLVATDLLTHTQVLDSSIAHLVPATARGLREGLLKVLSDRTYADRISAAALKLAGEQFSDDVYLSRVGQFYEQVRQRLESRDRAAAEVV